MTLTNTDIPALNAWLQIQTKINRIVDHAGYEHGDAAKPAIVTGTFENLGNIRLNWVQPGIFLFMPHPTTPFAFVRPTGERVEPRRMFTDGGSIPHVMRWDKHLDPWGYAPAYLLHDWAFELHHCEVAKKLPFSRTFGDANLMLMEAINTLIAMKICTGDALTKAMIATAVNSPIARAIWDLKTAACALPPDAPDDQY